VAVTLIDLGEPGRYDPGTAPMLSGYRELTDRQRRKLWIVAALVVLAGGVAGIGPQAVPDPQLHHVGRIGGSLRQVNGDVVISYSDADGDIVAYPLSGQGASWSVPADQPPNDIATAGDQFVIAFVDLSFLESTTNTQRDLPARVLAVEAASGRPLWQVNGWPASPLDGPVVGVVSQTAGAQRIAGINLTTGDRVWDAPLTGKPLPRLDDQGLPRSDELVIMDKSGAVHTMSLASGQTVPAGHVLAGADGLFEWHGLVGVRHGAHGDDRGDFVVYRLGQDKPLWHMTVPLNGLSVAPCGDQLCSYDSTGYQRIDPLTGDVVATIRPDLPDPFDAARDPWKDWAGATGVGNWEPVAMYNGHALVRLDPSYTRDLRTWLGEATLAHGTVSVRPLMPIGPRSNSCSIVPGWLFCDGSAVDDAVSVRLSELDELLRR
jgi:hypothetical protein